MPTSIKFKPQNAADEALLKRDSTLYLFDYRLDCEYTQEYLDSRTGIKNDSIPDYYTAVSINKAIPKVPYQIIEELYIPEQDNYFSDINDNGTFSSTYQVNNKTDLFNYLLHEAFIITGNQEELEVANPNPTSRWGFGKRWTPSGRITIEDNTLGRQVPLEGAKILMRQWFTIDSGITNRNGDFSTGRIRGTARYIIQWERYQYSIRSGWFGQAEYRGPKAKNARFDLNLTKTMDESQWYYATIHQGAHDYYYKDILGLARPQLNTIFSRQMKIGARQIASSSVHLNQLADWGAFPAIYLCAWGRSSERIYGTTIHELTHSAHHQMSPSSYDKLVWKAYIEPEAWVNDTDKYKSAKRTLESWAVAVEIALTNLRYNRLGNPNYQYRLNSNIGINVGNKQDLTLSFDDSPNTFYTSAFFDLTDNVNQRLLFNGNQQFPQDAVSRFTIRQVQEVIRGSASWNEVKIKLSTQYPGTALVTNELLENWQ